MLDFENRIYLIFPLENVCKSLLSFIFTKISKLKILNLMKQTSLLFNGKLHFILIIIFLSLSVFSFGQCFNSDPYKQAEYDFAIELGELNRIEFTLRFYIRL